MVGANPFRNPALVAKQITAIDHISGGRAILGIGAAWFETEHDGLGIEFGSSPGERIGWLAEALPIMRGMLDGTRPTSDGRYPVKEALNEPRPLQAHLPILVGGGGKRKTLRLVAQYADACNVGGGFESVKEKDELLRQHCEDVGRDESEIERTVSMGTCIIRDDPAEAERTAAAMFAAHGGATPWQNQLWGTPEQIVEKLRPFGGIGFHHFIVGFPAPFDVESMERLITEVKPELERG
jgi:alkanesulfonate monooxygenase SsuD/methylene tetrahydromethanopterin reductase-like flavin-dependent oxidoreductase (luciferase family)